MDWLKNIVDQSLKRMSETEILMMTPAKVPSEMLDKDIQSSSDWKGWKPIDSIIQNSDLDRLERKIGFPLPKTYREFLKYKHFYRLKIPDKSVRLPSNLPDKELSFLTYYVFDMLEPELIIGRGYIYFADFEDYGLLCFDANQKVENNEYPIVYIDHEDLDDIHPYADNFKELLQADEENGNRFIGYPNGHYN